MTFSGHRKSKIVNSLPFALNIVIKDPFLLPVMIFLRNGSDLCLERWFGYAIFLILLTKRMRDSNAQFAHFFYLLQVATDCGLECLEVKYNFLSTFARITFHQFILIDVPWMLWSGFISQWPIIRTKLWKTVSDLSISNDTKNTGNFQICFCSVFVILKSHDDTCRICTFDSSILRAWDDTDSFPTEIRMITEGTL